MWQLARPIASRGQPPIFRRMSDNVENHTFRLLSDMRSEHAAATEAVMTPMNAVRRPYDKLDRLLDRLDSIESNGLAFRAEPARPYAGSEAT